MRDGERDRRTDGEERQKRAQRGIEVNTGNVKEHCVFQTARF